MKLTDLLLLAGGLLVIAGAAVLLWPAALIVAGVELIGCWFLIDGDE